MSEEMLVRHCAPTLAGLKTGNLFSCEFEDEEAMRFSLRRWNRILGKKGLRLLPLRFRENRGLIYVFRPSRLSLDLQQSILLHCIVVFSAVLTHVLDKVLASFGS